MNVYKHRPTHRKYFFLPITVWNNCFFFTSVSLFSYIPVKEDVKVR